jgi:asparagine synthase (glutamine-hydrolysing)
MGGPARDFFHDVFSSEAAASRPYIDNAQVREELGGETRFGRKVWGLLSLELWQRAFHDRESQFKRLLTDERTATTT